KVVAARFPSESERIRRTLRDAAAGMARTSYSSAFAEGQRLALDEAVELAQLPLVPHVGDRIARSDGLSRREREVAMLIIDGSTNRQIAEQLSITERTAEHHLENIMAKLGVNSRTQVGVWAAEHGLKASTNLK